MEELRERIIKNFLDLLILVRLRNTGMPASGHDFIRLAERKFNILLSPGTIYALPYSMERDGLIIGMWEDKKRVYKLTEKGDKYIKSILDADPKLMDLIKKFLLKEK